MDTRRVRRMGGADRRALRVSGEHRTGGAGGCGSRRAVPNGDLFSSDWSRPMKTIEIPELALVALIGASGSGKSTLARRHFLPTEVLSSDFFRGLVSDDENDEA